MSGNESLAQFYKNKFGHLSENQNHGQEYFNVFNIADRVETGAVSPTFVRRDFFKIMLFEGSSIFHYADKSIPVCGNTLLFFNPQVPYTYEPLIKGTSGYFCVFKDVFFKENQRINLAEIPLFTPGARPVFQLDETEYQEVRQLFLKMEKEINTNYIYKYELIRSYVSELIYNAMKLQPSEILFTHPDASSRITAVFTELLERQFPLTTSEQRFQLRSPKDFAEILFIHVNHLNRAVKKTTGKTTTNHIFERLTTEAKALLKYSDLNIAEISYILGFEDQAHFNNFFKKQTHINPSSYRTV